MQKIGSENARKKLPELLERAKKGEETIITKRGLPVAALVPLFMQKTKAKSGFMNLRGSGQGVWSENNAEWIDEIRDEWK